MHKLRVHTSSVVYERVLCAHLATIFSFVGRAPALSHRSSVKGRGKGERCPFHASQTHISGRSILIRFVATCLWWLDWDRLYVRDKVGLVLMLSTSSRPTQNFLLLRPTPRPTSSHLVSSGKQESLGGPWLDVRPKRQWMAAVVSEHVPTSIHKVLTR